MVEAMPFHIFINLMGGETTYIKNIQAEHLTDFGPSKFVMSSLNSFYKEHTASPLSIKYVVNGEENYRIANQNYSVKSGQYFILNEEEDVIIDVNSKENTQGVCIYPPLDIMQGTLEKLTAGTDQILEGNAPNQKVAFTHKVNRTKSSLTGRFLEQKLHNLNRNSSLSAIALFEFYSELGEVLILDQLDINKELVKLKTHRKTTQEELYRRLSLAKDWIHDNKLDKIQLETLAEISCLSKFHFLRNFKDLYGMSPYQYSIQLKLDEAEIYRLKGFSYAEVSERVGFSDSKNLKRALRKRGLAS